MTRDDINFPIVNFSLAYINIPAARAYWVYISQFIRYARACGSSNESLDRGLMLSYWTNGSHDFESFKVTTMTWSTAPKYASQITTDIDVYFLSAQVLKWFAQRSILQQKNFRNKGSCFRSSHTISHLSSK